MIAHGCWLVTGFLVLGCSSAGGGVAASESGSDEVGSGGSGETGSGEAGSDGVASSGTSSDTGPTSDSQPTGADESTGSVTTSDSSGEPDPCAVPDADNDGHDAVACGGSDCDDTDPATHPGGTEFAVTFELVTDETTSNVTIDVDDQGVAYVGYLYDHQLRVADDAAGFWAYRSNGGGNRFDIHVAGDGAVQTAVVSGTASPNVMVWWPDVDAMPEYPDGLSGGSPSEVRFLAVDDDGRPHMLWHEYNLPTLTYAVRDADGWTVESIDAGYDEGTVIVVSGDGQPWIVYEAEAGPTVATRINGVWQSELLDGGDAVSPTAVVAPDGSVHVARSGDTEQTVRYSTNASGAWTDEDVGDFVNAGFPAIAVADNGDVYIVAEDEPIQWEASLTLLTHTSDAWQQNQLRADVSSMRPAATIAGGKLLVSHIDLSGYTVQLIRAELADGVDQDCDATPW